MLKFHMDLKVTRNRSFSAHHMLLGAAFMALEDAKNEKPGHFYSRLITITFSGLAIEAICNAFGERYIDNWKLDFEQIKPIAKLRLLCNRFDIEFNRHDDPWSSAIWLIKMRNKIAHAKPEIVLEEYICSRDEYDKRTNEEPGSKLEKEITLPNANKAHQCAYNIKKIFARQIPDAEIQGLANDGWHGSAEVIIE